MGIIKGCLKVVGTAALVATGSASTILKGVSDTVGLEVGSKLFGATKDASFNGIRSIWNSESVDDVMDNVEDNTADSVEKSSRRYMADTAYRMAQTAKQNGDMEKYETYMEKYYEYK